MQVPERFRCPETGIRGSCESPNVGTKNEIWVPYKISMHS